jgi:hypothetical protein
VVAVWAIAPEVTNKTANIMTNRISFTGSSLFRVCNMFPHRSAEGETNLDIRRAGMSPASFASIAN